MDVTFSKVALQDEANTQPASFSRFLNCANGTKSCKESHVYNKLNA